MVDFLFTKVAITQKFTYDILKKTILPYNQTAKEGAQTTIHLAVADEVEGITGAYFSDCKVSAFNDYYALICF